jgi:hypothetical protein
MGSGKLYRRRASVCFCFSSVSQINKYFAFFQLHSGIIDLLAYLEIFFDHKYLLICVLVSLYGSV